MKVQSKYGLLLFDGMGKFSSALTQPVDDVIAFDDPQAPERLVRWVMQYTYADMFPSEEDARRKAFASAMRWRKRRIPDLFLRAARKAARGKFPTEIAPHLERVKFDPSGEDEVPDFLALAAWSLDRAMRETEFIVRPCELCRVPFLSTGRSRFCRRLARSSSKQTCQDVGKVHDYRARRRAKQKEAEHGSDH